MDKIVHFEIPADDIERAKKFYSESFGWNVNTIPDMDYTIATTGPTGEDRMPSEKGFINGGMTKRNDKVKNVVITVEVEDIVETIDIVTKNGGMVVGERTAVGDMGFVAYVQDTENNIIGLWENAEE